MGISPDKWKRLNIFMDKKLGKRRTTYYSAALWKFIFMENADIIDGTRF